MALAALTASAGRLLDAYIEAERIPTRYLNLPFAVVALGVVVRGFAGWFLEREGVVDPLSVLGYAIGPTQRLGLFVGVGLLISLLGVRIAADLSEEQLDDATESSS